MDKEELIFKNNLPLARVKTIMKLDPQMPNISLDGVYACTVAAEMFLEILAKEALQVCVREGRKTISFRDLATAVSEVYELEFLQDIVPFTLMYKDALQKRQEMENLEKQQQEIDEALGMGA